MKNEKLQTFDYEGHKITFEFADGNKMVNATEMAKPFGKLVGNFLKSRHAKDYILLLESRYSKWNNGINKEVIKVIQGGQPELQDVDGQKISPQICRLAISGLRTLGVRQN